MAVKIVKTFGVPSDTQVADEPDIATAKRDVRFEPEKKLHRLAVLANGAECGLALQTKSIRPDRVISVASQDFTCSTPCSVLKVPTEGQKIAPITVGVHHARDAIVVPRFQRSLNADSQFSAMRRGSAREGSSALTIPICSVGDWPLRMCSKNPNPIPAYHVCRAPTVGALVCGRGRASMPTMSGKGTR